MATTSRAGAAAPKLDRDFLRRSLAPVARSLLRTGYFSLEVEGLEHVPPGGPIVYASNHAGWFALDAFVLGLAVEEAFGAERSPFFAAADAALAIPRLGAFLRRAGAIPASWLRRPERLPPEIRCCAIFPEGVEGNCKPFWEAYRMRRWSRGFVRVAAALGAPVVPVAVLGGEECLPVAWTVRVLEPLVGSIFGLPLAPLPLPTRWKVVFHAPVTVDGRGEALASERPGEAAARRIRAIVQGTLDREGRRYPLARLSSAVARVRAAGPAAAQA